MMMIKYPGVTVKMIGHNLTPLTAGLSSHRLKALTVIEEATHRFAEKDKFVGDIEVLITE
jgi:hypothetical protein